MAEIQENITEEQKVENQTTTENTSTQTAETTEQKVEETAAATATENTTEITDVTKASETVAETKTENAPAETTEAPPKKSFEELAKEYGYESDLEILSKAKEEIQKKKEEEERPFKDTAVFAEVVEYAGKNKLATQDDFLEHKKLNSEKDEVLAFNKFKAEVVLTDEEKELEPKEIEALIQDKFNEKFDLDADNERLKKAGLAEIKEIADEIRKPLNEKISTVTDRMLVSSMSQQHATSIAEFNKNVKKVTATIKDNEGKELVIEAEVTPTIDTKEVEELFKSEEGKPVFDVVYNAFKSSREDGDKAFGQVLENLHQQKVKAIELNLATQSAYDLGLEKGKSLGVGAKAPFNSKEVVPDTQTEEPVRQYNGGKFV